MSMVLCVQLYQPLNIYIVLVGVEVWTDNDRISVLADDTTTTLNNFLTYRQNSINPQHYNDNAQLITYADFILGFTKSSSISICLHAESRLFKRTSLYGTRNDKCNKRLKVDIYIPPLT